MNRLKKAVLFIGIGLLTAGWFPLQAEAEQTGTFLGHPTFDNVFGQMEIREPETEDSLSEQGAGYASKYDPRLTNKVSAVEDQGETNTCWAFATISAIESNLIKKGYADSSINLSENHLAYFFYNRQADPLGYTKGDKNKNLYLNWYMRGGNTYAASLHLSTWSGVVKQTTSENDSKGAYKPVNLPAGDCYDRDYVVEGAYYYNYSVNNVKKAIMQYGAVSSGIGMYMDFLSADQEAYYCPQNAANHAVAIVGWDDNYSKNNFNSSYRPKTNGAWIVKNSYGTSIHDDGYMYVSYEDASLCEIIAYDVEKASASSDNNYQYDGTGEPSSIAFNSGLTYANVFTAKASSAGYNEILDAAAVNVYMSGVKYTLQIYTGVTSSSNPTKGKLVLTQKGILTEAGYCRIDLNKTVTLKAGEKYSVVIKLTSPDGDYIPVGVEQGVTISWLDFVADIDKNVGFVKAGGTWFDCGDYDDMGSLGESNLRIKAYTSNTKKKTTYKLSSKNVGVSLGSTAKLSLNINPSSVKRNVTWTSSNKNVVTVSSGGKLKAKAYGTATIKAKFIAGKKTKTLSCKVTVGPSAVKNFKVKGAKKKLSVTWKINSKASGYEIYYSKKKSSGYKKLATITSGYSAKYTKKMKKDTYYVKLRPYLNKNGKKLYGSYTSVKTVKVK